MNGLIEKFHNAEFLQFATLLLAVFIAYEVAAWRAEWKRLHKPKKPEKPTDDRPKRHIQL
jgi:hypothetical protein